MNKRNAFWDWESNLESLLHVIFLLLIVAGLIIGWNLNGFSTAFFFGICALIIGMLIVGLQVVIIHMADNVKEIKEIMTKMDSTAITPMGTALSKAAAEKKQQEDDIATLKNGGWKCTNCGRANPSYTGTCACGNSKPN